MPVGSVEVRPVAPLDRAEVERLAEIFDRYRVHYGEDPDPSRAARWLQANLSSGRLDAFVANVDGKGAGFAVTMTVPASQRLGYFWLIRDLFVLPDLRRLGVGRALLDVIRTAAIRAGALRLTLQTEADNTPALRLYEESGYTVLEGYRSLTLPLPPAAE